MRSRPALLLVAVWLAGAVVATSVGLLAVRLVAEQVGDPAAPPLTAAAASSPRPSVAATPTPSAAPSVAPSPVTSASAPAAFRSAGGTVGLACAGTTPRLVYATPADGYALDERSVVGSQAEVRFEGRGTRVRMELGCTGGRPALLDVRTDARD